MSNGGRPDPQSDIGQTFNASELQTFVQVSSHPRRKPQNGNLAQSCPTQSDSGDDDFVPRQPLQLFDVATELIPKPID